MTRPTVFVEVAFNAGYSTAAASRTWTDVTSYVKTSESIAIRVGRQDEFSQASPNTCALTLINSDGRFTPGLATSPYYPNVKIGRPLRVCVNLLTAGNNGTFETNVTGWSGSNAAVSRTTGQHHSGVASMNVTSTAAADMFAFTAAGTSGIPVVAGATYRASAWYRRGGPARTADLRVVWYDTGGAVISTSTSSTITDSTTWQLIESVVTAPATAAYAQVRPYWTAPGASETHMVDDVRFDFDRFTGYIDEWPVEWPGVVGTFATSQITASSRMARMGLSNELRSVIEEEFHRDAPAHYYTLGEAEGATSASGALSTTSPQLVALTPPGDWNDPTVEVIFGAAAGPSTDSLPAVTFSATAGNSKVLRAANYSITLTGIELFFDATQRLTPVSQTRLFLAGANSPSLGDFWISYYDGDLEVYRASAWLISASGSAPTGSIHHIFVAQDGADVKLYVDGVLAATQLASTIGTYGDFHLGDPASQWDINMAHAALYTGTPPTASRIADHAASGLTGLAGEAAATRLARYAAYQGIPPAEYSFSATATTPMAHIDTNGQTPIDVMRKVEEADGGVLYDGRRGLLTYKDRTVRYNAAAVVTLDVNSGEVEVNYAPKLDRSALINKVTATLADGTYSVVAENTTSSGDYGNASSDLSLATTSQDEAHAAAWWRVNTYSEPAFRAPELGVQIESMSAARQALLLAASISDKMAVNNLYSQSDATSKSFFIEGYAEIITDSRHRIEFNVSPTTGYDVWVVEDPVYGAPDEYPIAY